MSSQWTWLVQYHDSGDKSRSVEPKFKSAASSLKGLAKVGVVDCEEHKSFCKQRKAKGLPSYQVIVPNDSNPRTFTGDKASSSAIKDFVLALIPDLTLLVATEADLDKLLTECRVGKKSWGLCILLLSNKDSTPPSFKALSGQYQGKVSFGELRAPSLTPQLKSKLGIKDPIFPSVLAICTGDPSLSVPMKGDMKGERLRSFINEFEGGRKCSSLIPLDPQTDFDTLSSKTLKGIVKEKGIECKGAMEKSDYISCIKRHIGTAAGEKKDEI